MAADLTKPFSESCCDGGQCRSNDMSAQSCGCDPGARHICDYHTTYNEGWDAGYMRGWADAEADFLASARERDK